MKSNNTFNRNRVVAMRRPDASRFAAHAFTLVELLVVIAITSILLFLLFGPIISSFNLTRKARTVSQAQDAARFGLERLTRELGRATYIYDNGLSPVIIPMDYSTLSGTDRRVPTQSGLLTIGGTNYADWARVPTATELPTFISYGRIDLAQPAVRQDGTDIIDPTTGQPLGGAELRPGVRGKRIIRYFLGLRFPFQKNGDGTLVRVGGLPVVRVYSNRYEFSTGGSANNPVILYRAEYDPTDGNLFDTSAGNYSSTTSNSGGFNDPAFFYATKTTDPAQRDANGDPTNGKTYGENWQAIAQPVLVSENVDLIRWNRVGAATNRNEKDRNDPFSSTTSFAPVAIPDDVATAGFLTSGGVETPAAVPTLYQTRYAAWTYPYTITVLRGSTNYNNGSPRTPEPFGALTLTVDREPDGDVYIANNAPGQPFDSSGTLTTAPGQVYAVYSPVTRKLFVKTPRLTFAVDADRGRIETAFPPLMGQSSGGIGVPFFQPAGGPIAAVTPGLIPSAGEVIPTRFKIDTRHPSAGTGGIAANQGILITDLFVANYQLAGAALTDPATMPSPLDVFGEAGTGTAKTRGVRIIPGSERLTAPVTADSVPPVMTSWLRVGAVAAGGTFQPSSTYDPTALPLPRFKTVPERKAQYTFDYDLYTTDAAEFLQQIFKFDFSTSPTGSDPVAGDSASGMAAADTVGANFLVATYFWQNNYSRNPNATSANWGNPLSATGVAIGPGTAARPEADIFRVDYATRQQYSINLGARVYDPTDGRAQTIQVSDKVIINNVLR